jgi:hypothetical protein
VRERVSFGARSLLRLALASHDPALEHLAAVWLVGLVARTYEVDPTDALALFEMIVSRIAGPSTPVAFLNGTVGLLQSYLATWHDRQKRWLGLVKSSGGWALAGDGNPVVGLVTFVALVLEPIGGPRPQVTTLSHVLHALNAMWDMAWQFGSPPQPGKAPDPAYREPWAIAERRAQHFRAPNINTERWRRRSWFWSCARRYSTRRIAVVQARRKTCQPSGRLQRPVCGPWLVHKSAPRAPGNSRSAPYTSGEPVIVSQVRS